MKDLVESIVEWQNKTFPNATPFSKIEHLKEEIDELKQAIAEKNPNRDLEYADCLMLLFGCAYADGLTYKDIVQSLFEKLEINKLRNWGKPDKNGVVKHIKN